MSSSSNSISSESDSDNLIDFLLDDTTEKEMMALLQQQRALLDIPQSSSGRVRKRRTYVQRDREGAHSRLFNDYFSETPTYGSDIFRRRFRMGRDLFMRIVNALESHDEYFRWRVDAAGKKGFSPLQKYTVAIRQLAYGGPADHYDEYLRVAETTAIECLFNFCRCVIEVFGEYYLRKPNAADCQRLLQMHDQRHGFPGMLGSLDCMHWKWNNCPVAWKGSNNDINVLNQSPLFSDVLQGRAPPVNFTINGTQYNQGYYLTYGIYPEWASFVKSFQCPQDPKRQKLKQMQEAAQKDIERAFGVLQARWAMIKGPSRFWYKNNINDIMYACIILHNMIIENEGDTTFDWSDETNNANYDTQVIQGSVRAFNNYLMRSSQLRDREKHHQLRFDLIKHIWARFGNN